MAGISFDDLIPAGNQAAPQAGVSFGDLIPQAAPAYSARTFSVGPNGELVPQSARTAMTGAPTAFPGFQMGLADPAYGTAQLAAHALSPVAPSLAPAIDNAIRQREAAYTANYPDTGTDIGRNIGGAVSMFPLAMLGGAPATLGRAALSGALAGGASGALTPITDQNSDFAAEKGQQAALGAATGGATGSLLTGLARMVQPQVSAAVQDLLNRGVIPRPGQIVGGPAGVIEDKLTSFPIIGDFMKGGQRRAVEQFNRAVYNDVLDPVGQKYTGPVGREAVGNIADTLNGEYEKLLPQMQFKADPQFTQDFSNLLNLTAQMPAPQAQQFDNIVTNKFLSRLGPDGGMDGQTLKGVESELTGLAKGYSKDPSFDNRQLGDGVNELLSLTRQNLQRNNPDQAAQLANLNAAWAKYATLRRATSMLGANEGVFTPAQLLNSVKAGDTSVGKGRFARGDALMQNLAENGKTVLGEKYPDSGTAGRAGFLGLLGGLMMHGGIEPHLATAGGLLSLPYTSVGQRLMAGALTQRPQAITQPIASALLGSSPALSGLAAQSLLAGP